MLEAWIEGEEEPTKLADLAQRRLRGKVPALEGPLTEHPRFRLRLPWEQLAQQEALMAKLEARIEEPTPFSGRRWSAWMRRRSPRGRGGAGGSDREPFPSDQHLASWAGMCLRALWGGVPVAQMLAQIFPTRLITACAALWPQR